MNKLKSFSILAAIALIGLLFSVAGCQPVAPEKVRIGTFSKAVDYTPFYAAKENGWFDEIARKYGTSIDYIEFQSLPPINEAFATDNLDLVFAAETPAIVAKSAGIDVKIAHPIAYLNQYIIVRKDSGINELKDLKGKKIALIAGTSPHYILVKTLKDNGVDPQDVQILDMIPPDAKAAFETGQVDAWAIWPPFIEQEEFAGYGTPLRAGNLYTQVLLLGRDGFLESQPELSKELLEAVERGRVWVRENPADAKKLVAKELDLPMEIIEKAWGKINFNSQLSNADIMDIQSKADFFFERGYIKKQVNANELI